MIPEMMGRPACQPLLSLLVSAPSEAHNSAAELVSPDNQNPSQMRYLQVIVSS